MSTVIDEQTQQAFLTMIDILKYGVVRLVDNDRERAIATEVVKVIDEAVAKHGGDITKWSAKDLYQLKRAAHTMHETATSIDTWIREIAGQRLQERMIEKILGAIPFEGEPS